MKLIPLAGDLALPGWHALRKVPFGESWALAGHASDHHPSFVRATCRAAFASFVCAANRQQSAPVASHRTFGGVSPREMRLAACWTIGALGVLGGLVFGTSRSNDKPPENAAPVQPAVSGTKPLAALASVTTPAAGHEAPATKAASVQPETPPHAAPAAKAAAVAPSPALSRHVTPKPAATAEPKRSYGVPLASKAPAAKPAHKTAHAPRTAAAQADARATHDREALRTQRWREIGSMQRFASPQHANTLPSPPSVSRANDVKPGTPDVDRAATAATRAYPHPASQTNTAAQLGKSNEPMPRAQEPLAPLLSETPAILLATPGTSVPIATPPATPPAAQAAPGHIEIVIGKATIRIEGDVDPAVLRHVLEALPA